MIRNDKKIKQVQGPLSFNFLKEYLLCHLGSQSRVNNIEVIWKRKKGIFESTHTSNAKRLHHPGNAIFDKFGLQKFLIVCHYWPLQGTLWDSGMNRVDLIEMHM